MDYSSPHSFFLYRHFSPQDKQKYAHINGDEGTVTKDGSKITTYYTIEDPILDNFIKKMGLSHRQYGSYYNWDCIDDAEDNEIVYPNLEFIKQEVQESYVDGELYHKSYTRYYKHKDTTLEMV